MRMGGQAARPLHRRQRPTPMTRALSHPIPQDVTQSHPEIEPASCETQRTKQHASLHRVAFMLTGALILGAALCRVRVSAEDVPILSVCAVVLFGMPHGALDVALASRSWPENGLQRRIKFIAEYIAVAAFVVLFWSFFPGESLCAFLALSALHFSEDWENELSSPSRLAVGASLLCFPALFHQQGVRAIFDCLVPSGDAAALAAGLHTGALSLLPAVAAAFAYHLRDHLLAVLEAAVVLALAIILTPLTFFLIYFCGLHSVRHLLHVRQRLRARPASLFSLAAPYALAAGLGIFATATVSFSIPFEEALLGSLFIGLAALTVPHMLLVAE